MDCSPYFVMWMSSFRNFITSPEGAEFRARLTEAIIRGIHPDIPVPREYLDTPEGRKRLAQVQKLIAVGKHPAIDAYITDSSDLPTVLRTRPPDPDPSQSE